MRALQLALSMVFATTGVGVAVLAYQERHKALLAPVAAAPVVTKEAPKPHAPPPSPRKFQVGDCILSTSFHEKWEPNVPRIILAIGRDHYQAPSADSDYTAAVDSLDFRWSEDGSYKKVKCPRNVR